MLHPRKAWLALVLLAVGLLAADVRGDGPREREVVSVENGLLRVSVDAHDGTLLELTDLAAGHNQVGDAQQLVGLWELAGVWDGKTVSASPSKAKQFHAEQLEAPEKELRLVWEGVELAGSGETRVEAVVRLDKNQPNSYWTIAVEALNGLELETIRFPRVSGLRRQENECLAIPVWMGQKMTNPRKFLSGTGGKGRRLASPYPAWMSLQCLAYYQEGGPGFYASCNDSATCRKAFSLWGTPEGDVSYEMVHYPQGGSEPTDRYELPYAAVLGTFVGDWVTAAERYRAWAAVQPWVQQSRKRRGVVSDWALDADIWVWNRGRSSGVLAPAAALQDRLGMPVSVFWHWWHGCPYDIGFPEYLPPREGTEPFRRAVAKAHEEKLHMLVYMNQRAWGLSTESWKSEGAERYAVKAKNGKIVPEVYNIFTGKALVSMCLGTKFWRDKYAGLAEEAVNDLGVDGIYMDQACSHKACYDPNHGHPIGGGDSWMQGFRALSEDLRKRCHPSEPVVLAGEGCGEAWLPYLDLMLALQVSRERYSSPSDPWEVIPFFHAVYHPYALTYGNYSSLVMPPYDELWPKEFAPAEPLALLDRKFSRQFYLEQARTFVWGQQLTLANFRPILFEQRAEEMEYLTQLARLRKGATKYLRDGEFLRSPAINAPEATSDFSRLSIYAGRKDRLTAYQRIHPLALAGAWRASDGNVAFALASVSDEPLPLSVPIDRAYYALPEAVELHRIDTSGRQRVDLPGGDAPLQMTLKPREACLLEFCKAPIQKASKADDSWETIAPFFSPPPEFEGKLGDYRSPLTFADGSRVKTPADWQKRRREILDQWQTLMGKWPPLITDPEVKVLETTRREDFEQRKIRFRWTPNEWTTGYLLIPDGQGPKPAVVTVYYEPETAIGLGKEYRDFAYQLARRGFVALSLGTTEATAAKTYALYYPDIDHAQVQPLSMLGYAAANAWYVLANCPEVDSKRIGIVGHSFGGKWAMFASCLFDKYACAVWSDPGIVFDLRPSVNYWEPWYLGYHPRPWRKRGVITEENPARGLYPELLAAGRDLHELHALMAPRPFLVSGGSEDQPRRWIPLNHTIAVNRLLGATDRVAMTNRPEHSPNEKSNAQIYAFFEHFLGGDRR